MNARQLGALKAELCKKLDARWQDDNRPSRSPGRPSKKDHVAAACVRVQKKLRHKKASLGEWYEAVSEECGLSAPTIKKFTKEWMRNQLPLTAQSVEIGPYLINTQKDYSGAQWILIWGGLCQQFPDVLRWLNERDALPGELPHAILPEGLQIKINSRSDFPLGPRLYDQLVRESLRNAPEK